MKSSNIEMIRQSFAVQARNFESDRVRFSKQEYLDYTLARTAPKPADTLLEVAAGTCICGRSFAPHVKSVVCLDATLPMLQIGKQEADRAGLNNMIFIKGYAEELPFLNGSFDLVFSRLAFHHFPDVETPFSEMVRVLKPGGRLVLIDMEAAAESLRRTEDEIETLRDPSHVRNLSKAEMQALFHSHNLSLHLCETTNIQQQLSDWLALTQTPEDVQTQIIRRMEAEIRGGEKTGFDPYLKENRICFDQRWGLMTGQK